jgi:HNH endonuclease
MTLDKFWSHVDKTGGPERLRWEPGEPCHGDGSPCWIWLRSKSKKSGCGLTRVGDQRGLLAYRVAWELENGPIPPRMCVLHWCDHPVCVNPEHLYLGMMRDVVLKRDARGHHGFQTHPERYRGSGNAKLTEETVREIRRLHRTGMLQAELKRKFNISDNCVSNICNGISYKHVVDESPDV